MPYKGNPQRIRKFRILHKAPKMFKVNLPLAQLPHHLPNHPPLSRQIRPLFHNNLPKGRVGPTILLVMAKGEATMVVGRGMAMVEAKVSGKDKPILGKVAKEKERGTVSEVVVFHNEAATAGVWGLPMAGQM